MDSLSTRKSNIIVMFLFNLKMNEVYSKHNKIKLNTYILVIITMLIRMDLGIWDTGKFYDDICTLENIPHIENHNYSDHELYVMLKNEIDKYNEFTKIGPLGNEVECKCKICKRVENYCENWANIEKSNFDEEYEKICNNNDTIAEKIMMFCKS